MSCATLNKWKAKYGGMTVSELRRLKDLKAENFDLKHLLELYFSDDLSRPFLA